MVLSATARASDPAPLPPTSTADYEVGGDFSQSANQGEGYLPYNTSFYRKHLTLPAAWAGTRVELYVEGALSASQWWLNGQPLANGVTFTSGYTALIMRLDNVPGVVWGGANVLVAFVDGTRKTGWWCVRAWAPWVGSQSELVCEPHGWNYSQPRYLPTRRSVPHRPGRCPLPARRVAMSLTARRPAVPSAHAGTRVRACTAVCA